MWVIGVDELRIAAQHPCLIPGKVADILALVVCVNQRHEKL